MPAPKGDSRTFTVSRTGRSYWSIDTIGGFNGTTFLDLGFSFALSGVSNYLGGTFISTTNVGPSSDFANLFDLYRIKSCELELFYTQSQGNASSQSIVFLLAPDYNDVDTFTPIQLLQYPNCKRFQMSVNRDSRGQKVSLQPRIAAIGQTGSSTTDNSISLPPGTWCNSSSTTGLNQRHLGLKLYADIMYPAATNTDLGQLGCYWTVQYEFKDPI